jgi:signal peptidase II
LNWILVIFLVSLDLITKALVPFHHDLFSVCGVTLSFDRVVNTGIAWGFMSGHPGLLFILRGLIIVGLVGYILRKRSSWPLYLILAGAIGNVIDYCLYGHVIDFIHFNFWGNTYGIFNIADSYITIGCLSLFVFSKYAKTITTTS